MTIQMNRFSNTFTWYYLFLSTQQNEIWNFAEFWVLCNTLCIAERFENKDAQEPFLMCPVDRDLFSAIFFFCENIICSSGDRERSIIYRDLTFAATEISVKEPSHAK